MVSPMKYRKTVKTDSSCTDESVENPPVLKWIAHRHEVDRFLHLPFLQRGYRSNHNMYDSFYSWFTLHIDTINIWSHFLGFLYYVYGAYHAWELYQRTNASTSEYAFLILYVLCAMYQMLASTLYHTVRCISLEHEIKYLRLDVVGIAAMIFGSFMVGLNQGFVCDPILVFLYGSGLAIILSFIGILMFLPGFHAAKWDFHRNLCFISAVAYGMIPLYHWYSRSSPTAQDIILRSLIGMVGNYGFGFLVFASRFPERFFPSKFDIFGASHQFWHLFVVLAGVSWFTGIMEYHEYRFLHEPTCPPV